MTEDDTFIRLKRKSIIEIKTEWGENSEGLYRQFSYARWPFKEYLISRGYTPEEYYGDIRSNE